MIWPIVQEADPSAVNPGYPWQMERRPISQETKPPAIDRGLHPLTIGRGLHRAAKPKPIGQEVNTPASR